MNHLLLDTSSRYVYLEFFNELTGDHKRICDVISRDNDNWLSHAVRPFLSHLKINRSQIYLGRGPGSFTGNRVSYAYFKTLAQLYDMKFFSFNSLQLWHKIFNLGHDECLYNQISSNIFYGYSPQMDKEWLTLGKEELLAADLKSSDKRQAIILAYNSKTGKLLKEQLSPQSLIIETPETYLGNETIASTLKIIPQIMNGNFEVISENILTAAPQYGHELEFYKKEKIFHG